ncbi:protein FAR1-related sequence 11, partial [Tanacetum coccineum]
MDETSINNEDILLDNMPDADNDILCPPKSIPKGRPRKGREKGGKESATKGQNRCSLCKQRGHTRPKCPQKDNIFFMVDDATSDKRSFLSKEDLTGKISKTVFVTNFPDHITARDLWNVCTAYGKVVDVYIPLKRSKT